MKIVFDTETAKFGPGRMLPELACMTFSYEGEQPQIVHHTEASLLFATWLEAGHTLIGHNVAYDMGVMCAHEPDLIPVIFDHYERNLVTDTMWREKLLDIAKGRYRGYLGKEDKWITLEYSLDALAQRRLGRKLDKDTWRLEYGTLRSLPIEQWPSGAITYPLIDARVTWDIYAQQEEQEHKEFLVDQFSQARAYFWIQLMTAHGFRTNAEGVQKLERETIAALAEIEGDLKKSGLVRENGTRDTKAAKERMKRICEQKGLPLRKTAADGNLKKPKKDGTIPPPVEGISLDEESCLATEDKLLKNYAALTSLKGVLVRDVNGYLKDGLVLPVHSRFDLVETGRVSSSKPNICNLRRLPGIRECFTPRQGFVYMQADYDGLELRTLAQVCKSLFGYSKLAEALNAGKDPHLMMGADIIGISYPEICKIKKTERGEKARTLAKVANFGLPGGLGTESLIAFAKGYDTVLTEEQAKDLKAAWFRVWPEMTEYFRYINSLCNPYTQLADVKHLFSNRIRGKTRYTAACNSLFQGLGSDATKHAGFLIQKACYADKNSPLYGSRLINYVYDEFIGETPFTSNAHEAAEELSRLMILGANEWLPDVPATTESVLMTHWSKLAERVLDENDRLVAWESTTKYKRKKGDEICIQLNADEVSVIRAGGGRYKVRASDENETRISPLTLTLEEAILQL